jgi:hypothetical protein
MQMDWVSDSSRLKARRLMALPITCTITRIPTMTQP